MGIESEGERKGVNVSNESDESSPALYGTKPVIYCNHLSLAQDICHHRLVSTDCLASGSTFSVGSVVWTHPSPFDGLQRHPSSPIITSASVCAFFSLASVSSILFLVLSEAESTALEALSIA